MLVLLNLTEHYFGVGEHTALDALARVDGERAPVDIGPEALADERDAPVLVVAHDAVVDHDARVVLAPDEDALVLEVLEAGVHDHHVRLEHDHAAPGVLLVAPELAGFDFDHAAVGQHARGLGLRRRQVELAVHQRDGHVVGEDAYVFFGGFLNVVFAEEAFNFVFEPLFVLVAGGLVVLGLLLVGIGVLVVVVETVLLVLVGHVAEVEALELDGQRALRGPLLSSLAHLAPVLLHRDQEQRALLADEDHLVVALRLVALELDPRHRHFQRFILILYAWFQYKACVWFQFWIIQK